MKKVIQLKFSRPLPSHSTLSPIAAEGRKTQGGAEKIMCKEHKIFLTFKILNNDKNEKNSVIYACRVAVQHRGKPEY